MKRPSWLIIMVIVLTCFGGYWYYIGQNQDGHRSVVVAFCGSAGKPALEECAEAFEDKTGIKVEFHFGGSGKMLSELEISKRGDLYVPGSPDYMAKATRDGVVHLSLIHI